MPIDLTMSILSRLPDEIKLAIFAGCEYVTEYSNGVLTIKTVYPIAIHRDDEGRPVSVSELRS